jgi:ABC-type lipoprotein export system ATPase subunit
MVTHDLRMCEYVDRVIQTIDGKVSQILSDRRAIGALANLHVAIDEGRQA